jgi:hypothetical protein
VNNLRTGDCWPEWVGQCGRVEVKALTRMEGSMTVLRRSESGASNGGVAAATVVPWIAGAETW